MKVRIPPGSRSILDVLVILDMHLADDPSWPKWRESDKGLDDPGIDRLLSRLQQLCPHCFLPCGSYRFWSTLEEDGGTERL